MITVEDNYANRLEQTFEFNNNGGDDNDDGGDDASIHHARL